MTKLAHIIAQEPVRVRLYGALAALLPLLVAFGVDITEAQSASVLALAYVVLIGGVESARAAVRPA